MAAVGRDREVGDRRILGLARAVRHDGGVAYGQTQQFRDLLNAKGNIVETIFYPGEGHGFQKRENQLDSLRRTIGWFDKYLKGK
ncbi:prolyl oligopeptidase family serine peptidase [Sphingopyxis sp. OPL5]|nr:prolyl oligopeptidase family serine peptidase [Sphingopyxis sp. OPL5]